jgi:Fe-S cluster assembly protein SufB
MNATGTELLQQVADSDYKYGFVTEIDSDTAPKGLSDDTVRLISSKRNEPGWMLEWRLKALRHFLSLVESDARPSWAHLRIPEIDFQEIIYWSAPNRKPKYDSLDEVDPALIDTFNRLGIPIEEQKLLAGVAVDVRSSPDRASYSAPSARRSRNTRTSCTSTWGRSCHTRTTSMRP